MNIIGLSQQLGWKIERKFIQVDGSKQMFKYVSWLTNEFTLEVRKHTIQDDFVIENEIRKSGSNQGRVYLHLTSHGFPCERQEYIPQLFVNTQASKLFTLGLVSLFKGTSTFISYLMPISRL